MRTLAEIEAYIKSEFNDSSTNTQTQLRRLINQGVRAIKSYTGWPFDEKRTTDATVASTAAYNLPKDFHRMRDFKITVGSIDYYPDFISSREDWTKITGGMNSSTTSDIPEFFTLHRGQFHVWPTPATSANTITIDYYKLDRDYTTADFTDYSTGTIGVTNADATVTGAGTTFAATMVNRYFRADLDGYWYKILTFTDTTHVELDRTFEGTTIASAGTYLIGTVPDFSAQYPEANMILVNYVLEYLWRRREEVSATGGKSMAFKLEYERGLKELRKTMKNLHDKPLVHYPRERTVFNPNLDPTNLTT